MIARRICGVGVGVSAGLLLGGAALAVTVKPAITGFKPASGKSGTKVTITGKNLVGVTAVRLGSRKAAFKPGSATKLVVTVPGSAASGKFTVVTRAGSATSASAFAVAKPAVSSSGSANAYPPNGAGTLTVSPATATVGQAASFTFTFTAGTAMSNGVVRITVPDGWTAPSAAAGTPGCLASTAGNQAADRQTIVWYYLNLNAGQTVTLTYGATSGGNFEFPTACGPNGGAVPGPAGSYTFAAEEKSTGSLAAAAGTPKPLASAPTIAVAAAA